MKDSPQSDCVAAAQHDLHICQLTKKGLRAEAAKRTDNPGFICHNCGTVANQAEDLCNPSPIPRR